MNRIEFLLNPQGSLSGDDDGKDYLVVEVIVDNNPLTNFQWFATDLVHLTKSAESSGNFYILTCWCGYPLCAGLKKPITVEHNHDHIVWKISEPEPVREFKFDMTQYRTAIDRLSIQGNKLIKRLATTSIRGIEITPDQNNDYFVDPKKYRT
ncbi:MAG: hypothetical protein KDC83_15460 [Flavobacteriales bacterium]|nr:hypothetical protein [Flavobacteriales bacterium]